jgi:hypothetical protein
MSNKQFNTVVAIAITAVVLAITGFMFGMPHYRVWSQEMRGKAALAEAEQDRQIMIEEAKANLEAQRLNAQAEVERAKGMAEAIEIEAGKLTADYIKYLWVRNMEENDNLEKIYIPTEANLPILEARDQ